MGGVVPAAKPTEVNAHWDCMDERRSLYVCVCLCTGGDIF